MRLAFVVPRYGEDVVGGAETLCRQYAEHLAAAGHDVRVLTTCARDHFTWRNELPAGVSRVRGVAVHRHPVSRRREYTTMTVLHARMDAGLTLDPRGERAWVENTGYSEPLMEAIARTADEVDALLFLPYLFASTVLGARVRPERSLIIPCLHDESYARFGLIQETLRAARGLIFNSDAERDLAERLLGSLPEHRVVGVGFDEPPHPRPERLRRARGIDGDFVAYAGRKEIAKGYVLLVAWMTEYREALSRQGPAWLVVAGSGDARLPRRASAVVRDLGYVAEQDKLDAFAGAVATAQLSRNESFSYVLMESWLCDTPVLVHAGCEVTRRHCEESGGGLWASSAEEFAGALDRLRAEPALRRALGAQGHRYVRTRYTWPAVLRRLEDAVSALAA